MEMQVNGKPINYSRLPEHIRDGIQMWIDHGIEPGSFCMAVIENDLFEAFARADSINAAHMKDIIMFFYNDAPMGCYGSQAKASAWQKARQADAR